MKYGNDKQTDHDAFAPGIGQDGPAIRQHDPATVQDFVARRF